MAEINRQRAGKSAQMGLDATGHLWAGPLLVGGSAMALTSVIGPSEYAALAGAGVKLDVGRRWRLTSLIATGTHSHGAAGLTLFMLQDRGQQEIDVHVSSLLDGRNERHRAGGRLVGMMFQVLLGS